MFDPASFEGQILHGFLLLLAVVNPIGNIPVYVSLTQHMEPSSRARTLNRAVLTALAMTAVFALLGDWSLRNVFEVSIDEFRVAGGILLFIVAARGVLTSTPRFRAADHDDHALAVFPLAFPIIVGPGSLALTIILAMKYGRLNMVLVIVLVMGVVFIVARSSHFLMRALGPYAGQVIARLLYLFLAAKAVSMVLEGLATYWKATMG
jgi:multiple antibiotic resistance protein